MLKKLKQTDNADLEAFRDITDDVEEADFVPYACLFDPHTILTKNGELLQIIKITGFSHEAIDSSDVDLRSMIRHAISEHIPDQQYAIWIHTLRRKESMAIDSTFPDTFSEELNTRWNSNQSWDNMYVNEVYLSIVRQGESARITAKRFKQALLPSVDRKHRNVYLDESANILDKVTTNIIGTLNQFGAHRLGLKKRDDVYYSESLEFLEKLINLEARPMAVPTEDLSDYLTSGEVTFAFNAMEVRTVEEKRRFASILTLKEYKESSLPAIDQFLDVPCEFIISQCFDFVDAQRALGTYQEQADILHMSGDSEFCDQNEITRITGSDRNRVTDFGAQQTTLFLITDSVAQLESNIKKARKALAEIGIVSIREDLKFEECYWAQLPGNFEFVCRLGPIDTNHLAGFAKLSNVAAGEQTSTSWGKPVSLFRTAAGTPYYFHFHDVQGNGHSSVIGPQGSGKSVLVNFLVAQARKFSTRLIYLDAFTSNKKLIEAVGGKYHTLAPGMLSPLSSHNISEQSDFLTRWLYTLIDPKKENIEEARLNQINTALQKCSHPLSLQSILETIISTDNMLEAPLKKWLPGGQYSEWFAAQNQSPLFHENIYGIDVSACLQGDPLRVPVMSYILNQITNMLDGTTPTIIVLDEGFRLIDSPLFAPRMHQWLEYLTSQNSIAIFTAENIEDAASRSFTSRIMDLLATQIFMPNTAPDTAYQSVFNLDDTEYSFLAAMQPEQRHFLLKRKTETIIGEMNLVGMEDIVTILSGDMTQTTPLGGA